MKAILEFDLDDNDDKMAHLRATKSLDMACALFDINQWLFKDDISLEDLKIQIQGALDDHNINVHELID